MDRPSGKAKRHQGLRRTRQAVLYQALCRPAFARKQASDVAFPPSFGGGRRIAAYDANLRDCTLPSESAACAGTPPRRAPAGAGGDRAPARQLTHNCRECTTHIFIAGPNAFAFLLGQHHVGIGRCAVYEWDFEGRRGGSYGLVLRM
jgi:hypothetical protein